MNLKDITHHGMEALEANHFHQGPISIILIFMETVQTYVQDGFISLKINFNTEKT